MNRRKLITGAIGAAIASVVPWKAKAALKPSCLLTAEHGLVRIRDMANCKLYTMRRDEWDRLWYEGRMLRMPE